MSLRFVLYLARRLEDLPVVVLVATRPVTKPDEDELLAQVGGLPGLVVLRPMPLGKQEVAQLVRESGLREADEEFIVACYHASGGNPFLLGELLSELGTEVVSGSADDAARVALFAPTGIVRWVLVRLRALGEDAQRLASAFAVLGVGAPLADAAILAGLDPSSAATAADALIDGNILGGEREYVFVHPVVRSAVYDALSPVRRGEAHARAARVLAERGAPLARVAAHLLASEPGRGGWAVEVLRGAAREAGASGAPGSAVSYLERALEETQPPAVRSELLFELGEAQLRAGLPGATGRIRQALGVSADTRRRAEICLALGRALFYIGDYRGAREALRLGLAERPDVDDDLSLELRGWYSELVPNDPPWPGAAGARLRRMLEDDAPARTRIERLLLAHIACKSALSGERPREEVVRLVRRALADGALLGDSPTDPGPHMSACHAHLYAGKFDAVIGELDRAIELSQRRGSPVAFGQYSRLRGAAHYMRGELLEALADLESAINTYGEGYHQGLPGTMGLIALCLIERGDLAGAARALLVQGDQERWQGQRSFAYYLHAHGRLSAAQGRLRQGLENLLRCERLAREMNFRNPAVVPWRADAALLAARLGDHDRAVELVTEDLRLARAFGAPHALGVALRAAGLIEGGSSGLEQLEEAVVLLDGAGTDLELARTLIEHGAALRRVGHRRESRLPLRRGLDLAASRGALALAERAHEELLAAGGRPRRERFRGADALTASELRVARMAVNGMTNRQIAQALFVTIRTVTTHLGHTYQKLDITGRDQLAVELAKRHSATIVGAA
jgi:DNA-binding CsgD family transcriptional regulator